MCQEEIVYRLCSTQIYIQIDSIHAKSIYVSEDTSNNTILTITQFWCKWSLKLSKQKISDTNKVNVTYQISNFRL
jgi:hypothetical protein